MKHTFKDHIVLVETCICCGNEVTEICGACVDPLCEPCHSHYYIIEAVEPMLKEMN